MTIMFFNWKLKDLVDRSTAMSFDLRRALDHYLIPLKDVERALDYVSPRSLIIELPIGLKMLGLWLYKHFSSVIKVCSLEGTYVWGPCDINELSLRRYDAILHLGHEMTKNVENVISRCHDVRHVCNFGDVDLYKVDGSYVITAPVYYSPNKIVIDKLAHAIRKMNCGDSCITYSTPYRLYAEALADALKMKIESSITGCYVPFRLDYDDVYVVSSGYFHALTIKLFSQSVRAHVVDAHRISVEDVESAFRRYLGLKVGCLLKARESRAFGIVVCRRIGQYRPYVVDTLREKLERLGKEVFVFEVDYVDEDFINNAPVECIVNTACPRVGFDDLDRFVKPIVNASEVDYIHGLSSYSASSVIRWI